MSKQNANELGSVLFGMATAASVGSIFLQALGAIALGLLGGLGGYMFTKFIKPRLDKWFRKKA